MIKTKLIVMLLLMLFLSTGCSIAPSTAESKAVLTAEVGEAIAVFKQKDPTIESFMTGSYGYAVLPKVFKGGFWVGGAYGRGHVFEKGKMVGYCDMSQATLGFSFGGKFFREIIFFRQKQDLDRFRSGEFTFSAQVTGVALTLGAAAKADYKDGMAVFVATDKGLMVDASLGGQKFYYLPASTID
ncbi:MAG: lipid-binding SYLF domain-containing protein [Planctomycetota bacterium]|jgi:lipid-binding SYLF domain-containing protein